MKDMPKKVIIKKAGNCKVGTVTKKDGIVSVLDEDCRTITLNAKRFLLEFTSGVKISGFVIDSSELGVIFKTDVKTDFVEWDYIRFLTPRG